MCSCDIGPYSEEPRLPTAPPSHRYMSAVPSEFEWDRLTAARPFLIVAVLAILTSGLVAAAVAHAPTEHTIWMVAYLALVVGLAQGVLGVGQALLPTQIPALRFLIAECILFNLGNVSVIAGTLLSSVALVVIGTAVFAASLGMFLYGVRHARPGWPTHAFRALLAITGISAIVGLVLSIAGAAR